MPGFKGSKLVNTKPGPRAFRPDLNRKKWHDAGSGHKPQNTKPGPKAFRMDLNRVILFNPSVQDKAI